MIRFWQDKRGSVAVIVAVSAMLLVVIAGAAVDFGMAQYVKSSLQGAADSAALAAGKSDVDPKADQSKTEANLKTLAQRVFNANNGLSSDLVTVQPLTVTYTKPVGVTSDKVLVSLSASMPTNFMFLAGIRNFNFTIEALVERPQPGPIDLALVLDTTGSMASKPAAGGSETKITTLKVAVLALVGDLMKDSNVNVQIGVVPYNIYVNTGIISPTPDWILPINYTEKNRCVAYSTTDCTLGLPYNCVIDGVEVPNGCRDKTCACAKNEDVNAGWSGLVSIRSVLPPNKSSAPWSNKYTEKYLNTIKDLPTLPSTTIPVYPGINTVWWGSGTPPTQIRPVTSNKDDVSFTINSLVARGDTFIPTGLIWGWNILDPLEPYIARTQAELKAIGGRKVMVLMTDGINATSPRLFDGAMRPHGDTTIPPAWRDGSKSNELISEICNNIKADGIEIFTVLFDVKDADMTNRMKKCATNDTMFFTADNSEGLRTAFQNIANKLTYLKVMK
jgi:Flp pilus assembly protein TadG